MTRFRQRKGCTGARARHSLPHPGLDAGLYSPPPRAREAIQRAFGAEEVRPENAGGQAVDSACRTIYRNLRAGKFELNDWSDLAGLFVRIAINKCIDKRREQHRLITNVSNGPSDSHQPLEVPAPGGLPIDQVSRAEANEEFHRVVDLVRRRLKRVNPKYVSIFNLRLAGGDTTEQIAQKVKCSEATVKSLGLCDPAGEEFAG